MNSLSLWFKWWSYYEGGVTDIGMGGLDIPSEKKKKKISSRNKERRLARFKRKKKRKKKERRLAWACNCASLTTEFHIFCMYTSILGAESIY